MKSSFSKKFTFIVIPTETDSIQQEEINAVGGNIPAIYIVRAVKKQAKDLRNLVGQGIKMATDNLQEQVRSLLPISSDNLKTKLWLKP
jgi:hypothetical protein